MLTTEPSQKSFDMVLNLEGTEAGSPLRGIGSFWFTGPAPKGGLHRARRYGHPSPVILSLFSSNRASPRPCLPLA